MAQRVGLDSFYSKKHTSKSPSSDLRQYHRTGGSQMDPQLAQKDALELFFVLRDKKYKDIIQDLFRLYSFCDIAKGVFRKYRCLPEGWRQDLEAMKAKGDAGLEWFIPQRMTYLTETTDNYPTMDKRLNFPERAEEVDRVVDEFITLEKTYFERLQVFMHAYVAELEAISSDKVGPEAARALGLTKTQVHFIFSQNLKAVYNATEKFLIVLESLSLVDAIPRVEGGRWGHLSDIVSMVGKHLVKAYAPYNATYQVAKRVLDEKARYRDVGNEAGNAMKHLNFIELWHEIAQSKQELKQASIDSILILPIKRFPNYLLLLDRIRKFLTKNNVPGVQKVERAIGDLNKFTNMIDSEVREKAPYEDRKFQELMSDRV